MAPADSPAARAYLSSPMPDAGISWRELDFSVIDFELTGLDPGVDEIISFATVTVSGGRVSVADARYELVRPRRMPDADTIRIHGLREADLAGAPPLNDRLDVLLEALTGRPLVAHVAVVERAFLRAALTPRGIEPRNRLLDTAELDRELRLRRGDPPSEREPIGLSDMARGLGLPVHRPHHADGDALTTAQAFIALATHLERFEDPLTLGRLEGMSAHAEGYTGASAIRRLIKRLGL
jgi:DNA polymerase III subunit epsilon